MIFKAPIRTIQSPTVPAGGIQDVCCPSVTCRTQVSNRAQHQAKANRLTRKQPRCFPLREGRSYIMPMAWVRETSSEQTCAVTTIYLQETLIPAGEGFPRSDGDPAHPAREIKVTPKHCWSRSVPASTGWQPRTNRRTFACSLAP